MNISHKIQNKLRLYSHRLMYILEQSNYPMLNKRVREELMAQGYIGVVFMLHRVAESERGHLPNNEDLKISPSFLEETIKKYSKAGFDFISLDEVYERLKDDKKVTRPFVAFTLDDGYLDNYENAYPIFKRYNVPFCIFVATDFIDKKAILWWFSIEDLVLSNNNIELSDGSNYLCRTFKEKWDTFRLLREKILLLDQAKLIDQLEVLFGSYVIDWLAPVKNKSMNWSQIEELSKEPLCTLGGHSISHPVFSNLSLDEIRYEIDGGVERLQQYIHKPVNHFAYPYGSLKEANEREYEFMKQYNFKAVFCSFGGCLKKEEEAKLTSLPRFMLKSS